MPASSTLARPLTRLTIKLVQKLRNIGVSQQIVTLIEDCLRNRTQAVVVDGHSSSPCQATSGVPQGSVVGPILFLIYINNLPNAVESKVCLFADHRAATSARPEALEELEQAWRMEFNPIKCEHIRFSRKRTNAIDNSYTLHNITMPKSSTVKYLGVNWKAHYDGTRTCRFSHPKHLVD